MIFALQNKESSNRTFLLELYHEDIPGDEQEKSYLLIKNALLNFFNSSGLIFYDRVSFFSVRRFIFFFEYEEKSLIRNQVIKGPRCSCSKEVFKNFLKKYNVLSSDIKKRKVKNVDYYFLSRNDRTNFENQESYFRDCLNKCFANLSFSGGMRYIHDGCSFAWIRFIRNVVCMLDNDFLLCNIGPHRSTKETLIPFQGRIVHQSFVSVDAYGKLMSENLLFDEQNRLSRLSDDVRSLCPDSMVIPLNPPLFRQLIKKNSSLYESHRGLFVAISIDLNLPLEIAIIVLVQNLFVFPVVDQRHIRGCIIFTECLSSNENLVRGYRRSIISRLKDAEYLWGLSVQVMDSYTSEDLKKYVIHEDIGSVYDYKIRVQKLVEDLYDTNDAEKRVLFQLCCRFFKRDLITPLVQDELTLQGVVESSYAKHKKLDISVVKALEEQNYPNHNFPLLPATELGYYFSLASKVDYLVSNILVHDIPSGSSDPLGVRRCAHEIVELLIDQKRVPDIFLVIYRSMNAAMDVFSVEKYKLVCSFLRSRFLFILSKDVKKKYMQLLLSKKRFCIKSGNFYLEYKFMHVLSRWIDTEGGREYSEVCKRCSGILDGNTVAFTMQPIFQESIEYMVYAWYNKCVRSLIVARATNVGECILRMESFSFLAKYYLVNVTINVSNTQVSCSRRSIVFLLRNALFLFCDGDL